MKTDAVKHNSKQPGIVETLQKSCGGVKNKPMHRQQGHHEKLSPVVNP
jgi:hypothetical protein